MNLQSVSTRQPLASVTRDGDFAYVQVGCGHITCKREGDRSRRSIVSLPPVAASTWSRSRQAARKMRNIKSDRLLRAFGSGLLVIDGEEGPVSAS